MKKIIILLTLIISLFSFSNKNLEKANEYMKNGDFKTAESYYKKAINEGSIDAMLELGTIYTSQLNIKEAEKLYLKAVKNNSEDGYNYLLLLYLGQGKFDLVEKCSGQAKWEHYDPKKLNLA